MRRCALLALLAAFALPATGWTAPAPEAKARAETRGAEAHILTRVQQLMAQNRYAQALKALQQTKTNLGGRRAFLTGNALLRLKRFREAADAFEKAPGEAPALEKYALVLLAKAALEAGQHARARGALETLLEKWRGAPDPSFVHAQLVRIHRAGKRPLRAAQTAERYLRAFPESGEAPDFLFMRAEALRAGRRDREAARTYRKLWLRHPEHPRAARAGKQAERISAALSPPLERPGAGDLYRRARLLQKRYRYEKAFRGFGELERLFPKSPYRGDAAFHQARLLFSLRKTKRAGGALRGIIRRYPAGNPRRAEASYLLARNHLRKRDQSAFESRARQLIKETRTGPWAARTRYLLARVYEDDRNYPRAARRYEEVLANDPRSKWAPMATFRLAWLRFRSKDYAGAQKAFARTTNAYPDHWLAASAAYWRAVATERAGERKNALARYRYCVRLYRHRYYGQMALRAIARLARAKDPASLGAPPLRTAGYREWMRPPPKSAGVRRVAELLSSVGLHEYAAMEYRRLYPSPYARYHAARALTKAGLSHRAIRLVNESFWGAVSGGGRDLPRAFWETVYPLIVERAEPGGAHPFLVNAVIRAESAYDARAISPAGARGLMQLMPATGLNLARKHKIRLASLDDLFDPALNARLGARYLGALLREFRGALVPAIASYNAGSRPVKRWWKNGRKKPLDVFIEEIPYPETKNYVKKVLGYYREYQRIYGPGGESRAPRRSPS